MATGDTKWPWHLALKYIIFIILVSTSTMYPKNLNAINFLSGVYYIILSAIDNEVLLETSSIK